MTLMYVDPARFGGASIVIGLFYLVGSEHRWRWTASPAAAWAAETELRDTAANILQGFQGPAITIWPTRGPNTYPGAAYGACGVFPDTSNTAGFYCYEKATDRWLDLSTRFVGGRPSCVAKPAIAYHVLRAASGAPVGPNDSLGQFWIVTVPSWLDAETRVSTLASDTSSPLGLKIHPMGLTAYSWCEFRKLWPIPFQKI